MFALRSEGLGSGKSPGFADKATNGPTNYFLPHCDAAADVGAARPAPGLHERHAGDGETGLVLRADGAARMGEFPRREHGRSPGDVDGPEFGTGYLLSGGWFTPESYLQPSRRNFDHGEHGIGTPLGYAGQFSQTQNRAVFDDRSV